MTWLKFSTFLLLATLAFAEDKPCTAESEGQFFDLNPLTARWLMLRPIMAFTHARPVKITRSKARQVDNLFLTSARQYLQKYGLQK